MCQKRILRKINSVKSNIYYLFLSNTMLAGWDMEINKDNENNSFSTSIEEICNQVGKSSLRVKRGDINHTSWGKTHKIHQLVLI